MDSVIKIVTNAGREHNLKASEITDISGNISSGVFTVFASDERRFSLASEEEYKRVLCEWRHAVARL